MVKPIKSLPLDGYITVTCHVLMVTSPTADGYMFHIVPPCVAGFPSDAEDTEICDLEARALRAEAEAAAGYFCGSRTTLEYRGFP